MLRSVNLKLVLRAVLEASEPVSRAQIALATGMTRSTVSRLVDELVVGGLLEELDLIVDGRRGRPATPLRAARGTFVALGVEINVDHVCARLVDLAGTVIAERLAEADYRRSIPDDVLPTARRLVAECLADAPEDSRLVGVSLAVPGLVDAGAGVVLRAPNLGWSNVDVSGFLAGLVSDDVRLRLANEADCSAVVVAFESPGRPSALRDFLFISGEVGIGSALVWRGELLLGRHGWAGEIGHTCVDPTGPVCGCGARGCLEAFAGRAALCEAAGVGTLAELQARLASGDRRARRVMDDAATALGVALANALNMLDVSTVVFGGHLGRLEGELHDGLVRELATRVLSAPFGHPELIALSLDSASAATGAAFGALAPVIADPADYLSPGVAT